MPTDYSELASLLGLRQDRRLEMKRNLERQQTAAPGTYGTGATQADVEGIEEDILNDPHTGIQERGRQAGIQDSVDKVTSFLRPETTEMREELQAHDLARTRIPGDAARDVAAINAGATVKKAQLDAQGGGGWAEPTVAIPDPYGTGGTYPVPRTIAQDPAKTRQFIDQYRQQGIAGTRGQADRSKIDAFNTLIDTLGRTYQTGEKVDWRGIGPIEGRFDSLMKKFGIGSDDEEALRAQLGRVKTREAFGEGGKQFTGTEERLVNEFLSASTQDPSMVRVRMQEAFAHARNTLRNLGVPDEIIEQRINAAMTSMGNESDLISDPNWGAGPGDRRY